MTVPVITAFYGGLLGILAVVLALLVINQRRISHIGIGDGGHKGLALAGRAFGNFAEYAPLALLLFVLLEVCGGPRLAVHLCAGGFVVGRVAHAYGISRSSGESPGRAVGVTLTFLSMLVAAIWLIVLTATKL
jgi:uncharacterized membrane protein YecN with MAPEG domain